MNKPITLLLACLLNVLVLFASSPQLVWYQPYGEATNNQQVVVTAIDNYDNTFAAGFVSFGNYGNIIINRYDGVGALKWNRIYNNNIPAATSDKPVALFPDNQAGVTVIGYVHTQAILTHIFSYDGSGNLTSDYLLGDTTTGYKTIPLAVLSDGSPSFYMLGLLNNVSSVFKCNNSGHVIWSTPVRNDYNNQVGSISFDQFGNVVAGVFDSLLPQVIIHRFDRNTGTELPGFNSHINSLPANGNFIKISVDQGNNIFLASTGPDTASRTQLVVNKFDTTGTLLWSTTCTSSKGHTNMMNSFLLDHNGDVLISGPYTDNTDTLQYAGVYKIANTSGCVIWSAIDSQFLVNSAVTQVDQFNNVYLGTTKTPSNISPYYSQFSFSQLNSDSGKVNWNRSFDNTLDNTGLLMQVNNFGDLFFATNTPTDTSTLWFLGRVGNAAGDVHGTSIEPVTSVSTLNVFPNPFVATTNISFTVAKEEKLSLKMYNITGQLLQEKGIQSVTGYNQFELNSTAAPGIYLVKLDGSSGSSVQRVVIY